MWCHGREGRIPSHLGLSRPGYLDVVTSVGLKVDPLARFDAQLVHSISLMLSLSMCGTQSGNAQHACTSIRSRAPYSPSVLAGTSNLVGCVPCPGGLQG